MLAIDLLRLNQSVCFDKTSQESLHNLMYLLGSRDVTRLVLLGTIKQVIGFKPAATLYHPFH